MHGEREVLHLAGCQVHSRSVDRNVWRVDIRMRLQLGADERADFSAVAAELAEQALGTTERLEPRLELLRRVIVPQSFGSDRGNNAQQVAAAMLKLRNQQLHPVGARLLLRDVLRNPR